jgi:hypothetical protein
MARFSATASAATDGTAARSKVVELALFDGLKERGQGRPRVDQGRTGRVPGVPHRDGATRQFSHLHTAPAGVADAALAPLHAELISRDAALNLQLFLLAAGETLAAGGPGGSGESLAQGSLTDQMHVHMNVQWTLQTERA